MNPKRLSLIVVSISLILAGGQAINAAPYYHSLVLDESTFKLGDTFIRPPVLWKTYTFQVDRIPVAACLKTEIFHQGTTDLPKISVNGRPAGLLSPRWADLSSRDYEIFFFDRGEGFSQAFDYNNWTTADCWISPDLLKIGENKLIIITARAGTSQADDIKMRNIEVEIRYLDREDKVTDLRRKSRNLPLPYSPGDDQAAYYPPASEEIYININAAGPDELIQLSGMGLKMAVRLIAERTENGPFTDLDDAAIRVAGVGLPQIQQWGERAYCVKPGGEAIVNATDIRIYRELKEIRQLLEKQVGKNEPSEEENHQAETRTREERKKLLEEKQLQSFINALEISNEGIRLQKEKHLKGKKKPSGASAVSVKTLKRGDPVPAFKVKALTGETISLKDLRGEVVLLDFWATWCGPCRPEIPRIREAYLKYHDRGFEVIGISLDKDRKKLEKFIKDNEVSWPQVFDGNGWKSELAKLYGVHSIPRAILLNRETRVYTSKARGKELDRALAELFKDETTVIEKPL